jgi:molecular chaperone GrpE
MTDQDRDPASPGEADTAEMPLRDALAQAEALAQDNWDRYLRAVAELENFRKRAARDVEQARKFGIERLAAELLPVLDSLEMGLEAGQSATSETLLEGKKATVRLLQGTLQKFGVETVVPAGEPFNPEFHEAISVQPAADARPGSVLAVVQKGYQLNGRLLRPARVVVAAAANGTAPAGPGSGEA